MVEVWLQRLVEGMQGTIKAIVKRAARNVAEMGLQDFIFSHPAQVALLGLQFQWTAETQVRACQCIDCIRTQLMFGPANIPLFPYTLVGAEDMQIKKTSCSAAVHQVLSALRTC